MEGWGRTKRARILGRHFKTLPVCNWRIVSTSAPAANPGAVATCQLAIEASSYDNSRSERRWKPGSSSESSQSNGRRFKRPGIPAPGVTSSPDAPRNATPARFDFYIDESGNAGVRTKKGSCEMQGDRVEMQIGETATRHNELVPRNSALILGPMG